MYHVGISFERRDEYCDRSSNGPGSTRAPWARAAPRRRGRSRRSWRIPPPRRTAAASAAASPPMATISQPWFAFICSSLLLFIGLIIRQRRPLRRALHFTGVSCSFGDCGVADGSHAAPLFPSFFLLFEFGDDHQPFPTYKSYTQKFDREGRFPTGPRPTKIFLPHIKGEIKKISLQKVFL